MSFLNVNHQNLFAILVILSATANNSFFSSFSAFLIIPGRQSRLSGVAGATCPDFRSHPGEL